MRQGGRGGTLWRTRPGMWRRGKQLACVILTHSLSGASLSSTRSAYLVGGETEAEAEAEAWVEAEWRVNVGVRLRWGFRGKVEGN